MNGTYPLFCQLPCRRGTSHCAYRTKGPSSLGAALHRCSWCWCLSSMHFDYRQIPTLLKTTPRRNSDAEQSCGFIHVGNKHAKNKPMRQLRSSMRSRVERQHSSSLWSRRVRTTSVMSEHDMRVSAAVSLDSNVLPGDQLPTNQITSRCCLMHRFGCQNCSGNDVLCSSFASSGATENTHESCTIYRVSRQLEEVDLLLL